MENSKYKWNLERILENSSLESLIEAYFTELSQIAKLYAEDIFRSKEKLIHFHRESIKVTKLGNRLYNYLQNKYHEDMSNQEVFEKLQIVKIRSIPYHQRLSDFLDRAIENREIIEEYLKDDDFKHLSRYYKKIFKSRQHRLSPEINKFMISYAPISSSYETIFTTLMDRNMPLKKVKNKGRKVTNLKTYEDFVASQYSPDRVFRKNAYYNWYGAVKQLEDTLAQILYFKMLEQNLNAKNCNFIDGFYESRIFEDELPTSFIPYIYKKVARFAETYKTFKKIRKRRIKKVYQLNGVKPWDLRMPVVKKSQFENISIEEAQQMVLEALSVFGKEYVNNVKKAFDERWIDWEYRPNKVNGAYCISGCLGLDCKYILLNYQHKLQDVYTLIHELGHAIHAVEYCQNQSEYSDCTIFIAEIPSSLNELLLSFYLIEKFKNNPREQLEIYDYLLNNFFAATINQVILSDWEYEMNKKVNNGSIITAQLAKEIYKDKQQKYQGNRITKELSEWKELALSSILTIPHFYSQEFYVYKYAVGKIVGLAIALMLRENPGYIKKYMEFLRSGSSKSNLDTLKILSIDLERTNIWTKLKTEVKSWVKKYAELHEKTK